MCKASKTQTPATCLHCESTCRLTTGAEVYPPRQDLHEKFFYICDHCDARVGCHELTKNPLGHAANKATRDARSKLHKLMLDPLWKKVPEPDQKVVRRGVYKFLARALGIDPKDCHTGMFTIERCRDAWRALKGQTPDTIRQWNDARRTFGQEAESDRKRRKHGRRSRKASRDDTPSITGPLFCPEQAARNEVPW